MRRLLAAIALAAATGSASRAASLYVCPDVPTTKSAQGTTLLPWTISRYEGAVPSYTPVRTIPGKPAIDAIHKMDRPGDWLFSVESPSDLTGALPSPAEGRDVVRYDAAAATYVPFFCGGSVSGAVPDGVNVDAILLDGGDAGDLWVSFDVPATIGSSTFDPSDLVAYRRTGGGCSGWALAPGNPVFDASSAGTGVPLASNVVGAAKIGTTLLLTFDVPTALGPPGLATFTPDEVAAWNGSTWSVATSLAGWPRSSVAEGLSGVGNPGSVTLLQVRKSTIVPGKIELSWSASCSEGATDYGIYEGSIGSWYSHVAIACTDAGADLTETVTPAAGNRYYLVVPRNDGAEGSYGTRSGAIQRPVGGAACVGTQIVTSCP
jgi:hypothetical protein